MSCFSLFVPPPLPLSLSSSLSLFLTHVHGGQGLVLKEVCDDVTYMYDDVTAGAGVERGV